MSAEFLSTKSRCTCRRASVLQFNQFSYRGSGRIRSDPLFMSPYSIIRQLTMTKIEQHKTIELLRDYSHKMRGRDLDDFEMFRKRDKDDEDLDDISRKKLADLVVKYVPERFR